MNSEQGESNPNSLSKKNHPGYLKNLSFYFTEYCDNTSIHGFKFLGERRRSIIEKIWWLIFIGVSLYFCIILISKTYQKWMNAPVMVTFATSETEIWQIPFPAVTVCPLIKADKNKFHFGDVLKRIETNFNYTEEEATKIGYMSLSCPKIHDTVLSINANDTVDDAANEFLVKVSPSIVNTAYICRWSGEECTRRVQQFFTPILTSGGICYSFNMLDRDEIFTKEASLDYYKKLSINHQPSSQWTMEVGFDKEAKLETYPRRTILTGTNGGLELTLFTTGQDVEYKCRYSSRGYKVILHHPGEIPRYHQRYFWVPFNQIVSVAVTPNMMSTSEELRSYQPDERKCYFIREKSLRFFKIYNQQNCLLECLSNFTYQKCDCVGFYMPRDNSTPICGPAKMTCLREANVDFIAREATFQMNRTRTKKSTVRKVSKEVKVECHCLPSCHSLHFDPETSQLDWDWHHENILPENYDIKTSHLSKLRIFFKDLQFMTSERNELYGQTDFWANCGGLLGLFTGFSFISLVEIIYFVTLRLFCNVRKYGRYYWSGADELLEIKVNK